MHPTTITGDVMGYYFKIVAYLSALFLVTSLIIVAAIDILNIYGISERLDLREPIFWHLFREGSLIEISAWICLFLFVVSASFTAAHHYHNGERDGFLFFFIMALAFSLMILENAGNIRHTLAQFTSHILHGFWPIVATTFIMYSLIGSTIIFSTIKYGLKYIFTSAQSIYFFSSGFIIYAIAAISSLTGFLWYTSINTLVADTAYIGETVVERNIMELLYEESAELTAAILFLLFASHHLTHFTEKQKSRN